jgi:hypothetical protein
MLTKISSALKMETEGLYPPMSPHGVTTLKNNIDIKLLNATETECEYNRSASQSVYE